MDPSTLTPEQLANTPLVPNPSGAPPNFINPPSRSDAATIAMSVMVGITTLVLLARLMTRWRVVKQFGLDDWLIIPGGVTMIATYILTVDIFYYGAIGRHEWDVRLSKVLAPYWEHSLYSLQAIAPFPAFFAKASIFAFLQRLFPRNIKPWTSLAIWLGFALNVLTIVVITLVYCTVCRPETRGGSSQLRCPNNTQVDLAQVMAALYVFLDLYILAIAIPNIWILQMSIKRRTGAVLVMLVGLAATVCSILTLYFRVANDPNGDGTWDQIPPIVIANFEGMVAIATACLPSFPALWMNLQENFIPSVRRLLSSVLRTSSFDKVSEGDRMHNGIELPSRSQGSSTRDLKGRYNFKYGTESLEGSERQLNA